MLCLYLWQWYASAMAIPAEVADLIAQLTRVDAADQGLVQPDTLSTPERTVELLANLIFRADE